MAHTGIFATAAECASKAGELVDATGWTEANINQWCAEAESYINCRTRKNWSDAYSGLNTDLRKILTEACTNLVAVYGTTYNMTGWVDRIIAEDMINVLMFRFNQCIKLLEDQKTVTFITNG